MTQNLKSILAAISLIFAILACNWPLEQVAPPNDVQTAAALTLQAILTPSGTSSPATPGTTTTSSPRVTATASVVSSATITITPTYSVPILTVTESTNCRTGPGEEYQIIVTYTTGRELEIVGRYDPGNFWLVKSNESPNGTCWLWGEFVDITGSYWAVPSVTPPATATSAPPRAPVIDEWHFFCDAGILNFTVTWRDETNDETGYRIFRNGEAIVELPANSTTHTDLYDVQSDESVEYYVQVYSPTGSANTSIMRMRCGG
jgi:uncharacterized protein YraI